MTQHDSDSAQPIRQNSGPSSSTTGEIIVQCIDLCWTHRRRLALWSLAGLLVSGILTFRFCKYEATTQLMPPDTSPGLNALAGNLLGRVSGTAGAASDMLGVGDMLGTGKSGGALFAKVLQSQTIQDTLVVRFNLQEHYGKSYVEDARKRLDDNTSIKEDKKSSVLTIVVRDGDRQLATDLAAAYIEELDKVMARVATSAARRERVFLEQRLAEERKTLQDSEQVFSRFASNNMALDVPQQTRVTVEAAARLQGEMIDARSQLDAMKEVYAPDSVRVKSLRARIDSLSRELAKINAGQGTGDAPQDPTSPYPSVKNLPLLGVQWADLYRNSKIHETVYELLTQRYEMARIQEAKEIPTVKVLDPAAATEKRSPRPWLVMLGGTVMGFFIGGVGLQIQKIWERWEEDDPRRQLLLRVRDGLWPQQNRS